jgi:FAD/FMN-containing dehydrogenase
METQKKIEKIKNQFREDFFSFDENDLKEYGKDWTKVYEPNPSAIAFPKSTLEVQKLIKLCNENKIPVVPSGGRTGLAGGAVAAQNELVVSLSKMNFIDEPDPLSLTLKVQAGAITEAVHKKCEPYGLTWPVDFGSKGSSQVGGNISTNAGGVRVIRYGLTRNWILGLTVVTGSGEILNLNGALEKNNTGTDLRQIFIGSEGIYGIITEAVLKLTTLPKNIETFLFATQSIDDVLNLFLSTRKEGFTILAFECISRLCLESVELTHNLKLPLGSTPNYVVLLEIESENQEQKFQNFIENLFSKNIIQDGFQSSSPEQTKKIWKIRELITESMQTRGLVHKHDIALPIANLKNFLEEFSNKAFEISGELPPFIFGHIGDGNLHINFLKPNTMTKEEFYKRVEVINQKMFELVSLYQGSVSAEHGIGLLKKPILHYTKTETEINFMKGLKKIFDPNGILNPNKIF